MELIEGIDLQTIVDRFGPMDPARVAHVLYQVAQSLDEAHRAGLVHRDIKPRNIMLAKLGLQFDFAKVLDFGLVKSLDPADPSQTCETLEGITTGTPAYMAPEVALGSRAIDGTADLYSLGCTAYYLLTGRMVFEAATPMAFALAHAQTTPPPMRQRSEIAIPGGLEAIVMQLLEKEPENRIPSAHELGRRLRTLHDVAGWTPEQAERWWEINMPEVSRQAAALDQRTADSDALTVA
jgi:serine/threonine-protein kinase